jgi:predicted nucleic acid-binding protein
VILADTSIWIDHFRTGNSTLGNELEAKQILMHPFVIGELACGMLRHRARALDLLVRLPRLPVASDEEAMLFLERHRLMGRGIGLVDVHLLASVALGAPARLWTRDRRLAEVAAELRLARS